MVNSYRIKQFCCKSDDVCSNVILYVLRRDDSKSLFSLYAVKYCNNKIHGIKLLIDNTCWKYTYNDK